MYRLFDKLKASDVSLDSLPITSRIQRSSAISLSIFGASVGLCIPQPQITVETKFQITVETVIKLGVLAINSLYL